MPRLLFLLAISVCIVVGALLLGAAAPPPAQADGTGSISGTVKDAGGDPLGNIDVNVYASLDDYNNGSQAGNGTQTDSDGTYDLGGLPTGSTYIVEFRDDNSGDYLPQYYDGKATAEAADPVAVSVGATTSGIDAVLAAAGHITGTVTAQVGGVPLPNISVNVYASLDDYDNGNQVANTQTDENGTYDLDGLLASDDGYIVEFRDDNNGDYATQYFNAKATVDSADLVPVTAGASSLNIDAALAPAAHITGTVTRAGGGTLGSFNVWAWVSDGHGGWRVASSSGVAGDGSYNVGGLAAGSYRVGFGDITGDYLAQWYNNKPDVDSADPVTIVHAGDTMLNIDATLLGNTPAGTNVAVDVEAMAFSGTVTITYGTVTVAGVTSVDTSTSDPGSATFEVAGSMFWDIATTATYDTSGGITVGLPYDPTGLTLEQQQALKLMHLDNGTWTDVTTSVDTTADVVYGSVTHFSWFALGADTKPPTTTVSGADDAWHSSPVTLSFAPTDAVGGSGMSDGAAKTEYQLDSGAWTSGTSLVVSTNGTHTVSYRSTDAAGNTETARSVTVKVDASTPTISATALPTGWSRAAVTLSLSAAGGPSGAVAQYQLDGGAWTTAAALTISADGSHSLAYRALSGAGILSPTATATVKIDTIGPTTSAKAAKGRKGKAISLKCLVSDNLSPQATGVTLTVKNAKHKVVKSFSLGTKNVATWYSVKWKPKAKGTYRYSVSAKDLAGNAPVKVGSAKIKVK